METILRGIKRNLVLNGEEVSIESILANIEDGEQIKIVLKPVHQVDEVIKKEVTPEPTTPNQLSIGKTYIIKVRQYMTKPASPEFDFHTKFNNDTPMPFRIMKGTVIKETRGMVQMDCHVVPMETDVCMRCGRRLSHPISKLYGIGPECGSHAYINPFQTKEELDDALDSLKFSLQNITWKGWVIKSAIEEYEEVV